MPDPTIIGLIVIVFILAGMVKGVIGLGLPTISLVLLTLTIDSASAMALLLVPSFTTNVWQMVDGGNWTRVCRRIWPFLIAATVTVWLGALALTRVDTLLLTRLLGALIIVYAVLGLTGFRFSLSQDAQRWVGPVSGILNGVLTGMTGSFVFPGVFYLQSIGLSKNVLIQAMGMLFTVSTLALAFALSNNEMLTKELSILSTLAVIPALLGMYFGRLIRQRLSEKHFRTTFFVALLLLGLYIML